MSAGVATGLALKSKKITFKHPITTTMKKTISVVVVTGDNVHHVEQIKSTHPSPISQAMANIAYKYRKAGKGSPTILKAY